MLYYPYHCTTDGWNKGTNPKKLSHTVSFNLMHCVDKRAVSGFPAPEKVNASKTRIKEETIMSSTLKLPPKADVSAQARSRSRARTLFLRERIQDSKTEEHRSLQVNPLISGNSHEQSENATRSLQHHHSNPTTQLRTSLAT
jgi:hypothetical protein